MPTQQLTANNYLRLYPVVGEMVVQWGLTDLGLKRLHELGSAPKPVSWDKLVGNVPSGATNRAERRPGGNR